MTEVVVALATAPDAQTAESLVRTLVEEELVACGNIVPGITSWFRWQGATECSSETLIVFKTTTAAASALAARVAELHPYDVPELLVLPVREGHAPYLAWVAESVAKR